MPAVRAAFHTGRPSRPPPLGVASAEAVHSRTGNAWHKCMLELEHEAEKQRGWPCGSPRLHHGANTIRMPTSGYLRCKEWREWSVPWVMQPSLPIIFKLLASFFYLSTTVIELLVCCHDMNVCHSPTDVSCERHSFGTPQVNQIIPFSASKSALPLIA